MRRSIAVVAAALALLPAGTALAGPAGTDSKSEMFYAVVAHPDDEFLAWSMIASRAHQYTTFVTLTMGEGTFFCRTPAEAQADGNRGGPYGYEGPDSPVRETDHGERHPLDDPWVGRYTDACKRARIASWHWFLDDMNAMDGSGTSMEVEEDPYDDDDFQGRFCLAPGHQGAGDGQAVSKRVGCADVWADEQGARVAFDLGNGAPKVEYDGIHYPPTTIDREEIAYALAALRANRASWGIPELPEDGMLAALQYEPRSDESCEVPSRVNPILIEEHPDHAILHESFRYDDHGAGPQYAPVFCRTEPFLEGAETEVHVLNPLSLFLANETEFANDNYRKGALNVNYGWLANDFGYAKSAELYWKVNG